MSKPTYEELEQERNELAAQVERLRSAAYSILVNRTGMDEWYDLEKAYRETIPAALAALKAQWQAESFEIAASICEDVADTSCYDVVNDALHEAADKIRQRTGGR